MMWQTEDRVDETAKSHSRNEKGHSVEAEREGMGEMVGGDGGNLGRAKIMWDWRLCKEFGL